ncbi:organic solvent tolerance protein [Candidatus Pelagibacter ubique]|nr:organic solvent tolerance protein [Candidatus Pelagibacter ubique]
MKNRFITFFLVILFTLSNFSRVLGEEFIFEITDLEITENGNIYKGNNRGTIRTDSQLKLISDNFEYLKEINRLEANGDVQLFDLNNNITINAQQIFYLKNEEKIFTVGKTLIKISNKYNIEGFDLILFKNKMILSSKKNAIITDNESNTYKLEQFQYSINQEILKGENIIAITSDKENKSDEFFFKTGFFDLKKNEFLGKDIAAKFHKNLFGDTENDPRISAVSGFGDKINTYFKKGVFTSCKKTDKCPPWKITSDEIHHDKIKKQINYKNAWLEIYDLPVIYFPKFFHPDPSVARQSGFLKPELGSSKNLGNSIYSPYFYVISKDKDITFKPRFFENNKFILQSEYRQKTKNSLTITDFSFTKGHDSSLTDKGDTRSHFFTNTLIDLTLENYTSSMLEINYQKASNDNYLKLFDLSSPLLLGNNDTLESIIKLDLEHQDYDLTTTLEVYETLNGSNTDRYQYVLPSYNFSKNFFLENFEGSFFFSSNGDNTLKDTNVTSSTLFNNLNYIADDMFFDNGIKSNFEILFKNINSIGRNDVKYKNSPQSELMSAYIYNATLPMKKNKRNITNTLTPKISLRLSPHEMKNNINTSRRMDVGNIFISDRLGLGNSFESGESITLGLDFSKEKMIIKNNIAQIEKYFDFKLSNVFRLNEEKNLPTNSTLNKKQSNIFGKLNYKPIENILLNYDFSLTSNFNNIEYSSLLAHFNFGDFSTQFDYLEEQGVIGEKHVIENTTKYNFNESNSLSFSTRRDRKLDLTEYYDLVYEYKNDCLVAGVKYKKNYYNDADIKPVEELFFSITIIPFATFSPDKIILNQDRID